MIKKKFFSPSSDVAPLMIPAAEDLQSNISSAERHIAAEKLMLLRSKFDRERTQWEAIVSQRDREIIELRLQVSDLQARCAKLRTEYQDMQAVQAEHVKAVVKELDSKRSSDKQKLDAVLAEIKTMTDMVVAAQSNLFAEQEKLHQVRKNYAQRQRQFDEQMHAKAEELADLQELLSKKEEAWLSEKSAQSKEIFRLTEELHPLRTALEAEKAKNAALLEQKNAEIAKLQAGVQDAVLHLAQERREYAELQKKIFAFEQQESALQESIRRLQQDAQMSVLRQPKAP
jgi:chromosome segregation ATPase